MLFFLIHGITKIPLFLEMTNLQCCLLPELTLFGEYEVNRRLSNFTEDHTNTAVSTNDNKDF